MHQVLLKISGNQQGQDIHSIYYGYCRDYSIIEEVVQLMHTHVDTGTTFTTHVIPIFSIICDTADVRHVKATIIAV